MFHFILYFNIEKVYILHIFTKRFVWISGYFWKYINKTYVARTHFNVKFKLQCLFQPTYKGQHLDTEFLQLIHFFFSQSIHNLKLETAFPPPSLLQVAIWHINRYIFLPIMILYALFDFDKQLRVQKFNFWVVS